MNVGRFDRHESVVACRNGIAVTIFLPVSDEQILGFFNELFERCFGRFHIWVFYLRVNSAGAAVSRRLLGRREQGQLGSAHLGHPSVTLVVFALLLRGKIITEKAACA